MCLWLVPFSVFISLSANDMVLPTLGGPDGAKNSGEGGGFLCILCGVGGGEGGTLSLVQQGSIPLCSSLRYGEASQEEWISSSV